MTNELKVTIYGSELSASEEAAMLQRHLTDMLEDNNSHARVEVSVIAEDVEG